VIVVNGDLLEIHHYRVQKLIVVNDTDWFPWATGSGLTVKCKHPHPKHISC